jgi:hypothetical protein
MKVGTRFIALRSTHSGDVTEGKTYEVVGIDSDGDEFFIDDAGDENFAVSRHGVLRHGGYKIVD